MIKKEMPVGDPWGFVGPAKATRSHELLWIPAKMQHYD
jgi:hypothetical protein